MVYGFPCKAFPSFFLVRLTSISISFISFAAFAKAGMISLTTPLKLCCDERSVGGTRMPNHFSGSVIRPSFAPTFASSKCVSRGVGAGAFSLSVPLLSEIDESTTENTGLSRFTDLQCIRTESQSNDLGIVD